ncbi:LytR/AlgR family response regulator transcription factor [Cyclobacterium qasimii]|uniref:Two-component system response regulator n=2 Tax=Cyclobacterium qasimii TaxID=1350429 RepID=S7VNF8_9BACT|nr:response regulator transcription factor [Cyclobacterium qasimii]EPR71705.1 two-component system response regulator [Cyclobacterium qasimii M12-11B]GEO22395.1 DNA-binding response regulator [Cyclobacterium qasimii]
MKINCIIIDDEVLALDILEDYISRMPMLELKGRFDSPLKAMDCIVHDEIKLMFLDINMPDMNGIKFYESLSNKPKVIFTTAYSEYAVKGFEINAIDYLLKPISFSRFFQAVGKVIHIPNVQPNAVSQAGFQESQSDESSRFIFVKVEHFTVKVSLKDIAYLQGYKDYVKIYLIGNDKPILTLNSIKHYEMSLFSKGFIRIHKSYIVSVNQIEIISRNKVKLIDQDLHITIGGNYRDFFYELVVNKNI